LQIVPTRNKVGSDEVMGGVLAICTHDEIMLGLS